MAPREGPGGPYPLAPPSTSGHATYAAYDARTPTGPLVEAPTHLPGRGHGRPAERTWDTRDADRRQSFSGSALIDTSASSQRHPDDLSSKPRDLSIRPFGRAPVGSDRRDDRVPPRVANINNVPIAARPAGYASDHPAPIAVRSPVEPFRRADDFRENSRRPGLADSESFDRRRQPPIILDVPSSEIPRTDRAGQRPSVSQDEPPRLRGVESMVNRPSNALPPRPRDGPRDGAALRQSRFGPPPADLEPRIWQTRDEAQSSRVQDAGHHDDRVPRDLPRSRDGNPWDTIQDHPSRRWPDKDVFPLGSGARDTANSRARSPEASLRGRPDMHLPRNDMRRYDGPPTEPPVVMKVHPERARFLAAQSSDDADRSFKFVPPRRQGRSPDRAYPERQDDLGRDLPPRPVDDARLHPPRERSPPPAFNGHRPIAKRGGSLLERLTLDDGAPLRDSGVSLRDRVDPHESSEGTSAHVDLMDIDPDGNGNFDDNGKGGRGMGRRRGTKPRGRRRFAAS
ncbi:hypothetical protein BC628DRAFT_1321328 [Trametes gibbosa]|nr:hypothetical protein BC628DRAFT_1321328 [Trametes gibbosa]